MASVCEEFAIAAPPDRVWAAVRDIGQEHRLFTGVVADARRDGDAARVVTFANGAVVRELIVDCDDGERRLAYTSVDGPLGLDHHHATLQVHDAGDGTSRVVWITDLLPDEKAPPVQTTMRLGAQAMRETLEA